MILFKYILIPEVEQPHAVRDNNSHLFLFLKEPMFGCTKFKDEVKRYYYCTYYMYFLSTSLYIKIRERDKYKFTKSLKNLFKINFH